MYPFGVPRLPAGYHFGYQLRSMALYRIVPNGGGAWDADPVSTAIAGKVSIMAGNAHTARRPAVRTRHALLCAECGVDFTNTRKEAKFCGTACANRHKNRTLNKLKGEQRTALSKAKRTRICEHCGASFVMHTGERTKGRFCSTDCRWTSVRSAAALNDARRDLLSVLAARRECVECGGLFMGQQGALICSAECRAARYRAWVRQRDGRDTAPRPCRECGTVFSIGADRDGRRDFCSKECGKRCGGRVAKAVRRARMYGVGHEPVDPFAVFERDGWTCYLCHEPTPRELRGTHHDRAPELDHRVPLALGGPHTYANTACACRACNQAKGASVAADATPLPLKNSGGLPVRTFAPGYVQRQHRNFGVITT